MTPELARMLEKVDPATRPQAYPGPVAGNHFDWILAEARRLRAVRQPLAIENARAIRRIIRQRDQNDVLQWDAETDKAIP